MARIPTEREAGILRDMYKWYRSWGPELPKTDAPVQRDETFFGIFETPAGGIPAMADDVPGEADCIVYWYDIDGDGVIEAVGDGTETETIRNRFEVAVPASTKIYAARDPWGTWWYFSNQSGCDNPPPGVYQGTAGGPIAAGDTGTVLIDGTEYQATNHSNCPVELSDRVFVGVSNDCDIFFTPCVCCSESTDCCDIFVAICICGDRQVLAVDGGNYTWDVLSCCDGCEEEAATLEITLSCSDPTITASWDYTCGATTDSGTVDLSSLCDDTNEVLIEDGISITGCTLNDSYANYLMECNTETAECCVDWNSSGEDTGSTGANANTNSVSGTSPAGVVSQVSVSKFDTLFCQGQTITVTMTVTGHDGGADPLIILDNRLNSCAGNSSFSVQSHSPAGSVAGTTVTWPGGGDGTYIVTYKWDSGCFSTAGGCTVGTAVLSLLGSGSRDSGALHIYVTTSSVT